MQRESIVESGLESGIVVEAESGEKIVKAKDHSAFKPTTINPIAIPFDPSILKKESQDIIKQLIKETDPTKVKDLSYLYNLNQNKKTMVRQDKLNELLDTITDQTLTRFKKRPDEWANKELFEGLKVISDLIAQSQKQTAEPPKPIISVAKQEINIGPGLDREAKERVGLALDKLLKGYKSGEEVKADIIDADVKENKGE